MFVPSCIQPNLATSANLRSPNPKCLAWFAAPVGHDACGRESNGSAVFCGNLRTAARHQTNKRITAKRVFGRRANRPSATCRVPVRFRRTSTESAAKPSIAVPRHSQAGFLAGPGSRRTWHSPWHPLPTSRIRQPIAGRTPRTVSPCRLQYGFA